MAASADVAKPLRVLVSEGSSTSAREAVTILGLSGHHRRGLRPEPLLPGAVLAVCPKIPSLSGPAGRSGRVPSVYRADAGDRAFRRAAADPRAGISVRARAAAAGWPRRAGAAAVLQATAPCTARPASAGCSTNCACRSRQRRSSARQRNCATSIRFPAVVKTSVGTASRGVWLVRDDGDLDAALHELGASGAFAGEVVVQDFVAGATEKAQAVFCRGRLIGFHGYRQIAAGVGGGEAIKESVSRPDAARGNGGDRRATRLARCIVGRLHLA